MRRLENPCLVWLRIRAWSGGWRLDMTATGLKSGAAKTAWAAALRGNTGSCTFWEPNISGFKNTSLTSSMRVTTR